MEIHFSDPGTIDPFPILALIGRRHLGRTCACLGDKRQHRGLFRKLGRERRRIAIMAAGFDAMYEMLRDDWPDD